MPIGSAIAGIIGTVVTVAGTVTSGAMQAASTSEANAAQMQMYEEKTKYEKSRDEVKDKQWRAEYGLAKQKQDVDISTALWQRREGKKAIKLQKVQQLGANLSRLATEDPVLTSNMWNMFRGGRRNG